MKPPRATGDEGFTLVELLMAVVLLGVGAAAVMYGFLNSVGSSDRARQQAQANVVVTAAAEAVIDQNRNPFVTCATATTYSPTVGVELPAGWTAANLTLQVRFWNPRLTNPADPSSRVEFDATCPWTGMAEADVPAAAKLQEITVTATHPNGRASRSLVVLKRGA